MSPHISWEHLSSPALIRERAKLLAAEHTDMLSELVEIRKARGMTQADIASILGTSQQNVSKLESYDANPRLDTLRTYANAIGAILDIHVRKDTSEETVPSADQQWELLNKLPKSTTVTARRLPSHIRHIHDWSDKVTYPVDSKRVDFALSA